MARKYDHEYKVQAVKLAKEIGGAKAAKELGIPEGTIHTWLKAVRAGKLDIGEGSHTPTSAMSLSEEITMLRKRVKEQDKEIRRLKKKTNSWRKPVLFSPQPSEVGKNQRMIFLALKTEDGRITGKISFYCRMLGVSRQGFYKYLANKDRPWKYQDLADAMKEIVSEDECNDTYGRIRMYQALLLKQPEGVHIPSERTVYRVMDQIGLTRYLRVAEGHKEPDALHTRDVFRQGLDLLVVEKVHVLLPHLLKSYSRLMLMGSISTQWPSSQ